MESVSDRDKNIDMRNKRRKLESEEERG